MNAASSSGGVGGMVPSTTMLMNGLLYDPSLVSIMLISKRYSVKDSIV